MRRVNSELLSSMRRVTRFTGYLIPPLGILMLLEALFLRGDTINSAVVATAAGLLGMLPKGLVLLISISLAAGIIALSKKKVLVQELFALETLAHVDTLCLDKTGTLTQGAMQVEEVRLTDAGRSMPFDEIMSSFLKSSDDCNATFQALQSYFGTNGSLVPIRKIAFSSERKWSAAEFQDFIFVVGAPERIAGKEELELLKNDFSTGKRIVLAGIADGEVMPDKPLPEMRVLGVIALFDPIRPDVEKTLDYFRREGVSLKLISGDNPETAAALAAKAGFHNSERYIDMSNVTSEADIERTAAEYSVFGRVSPLQKKQLVQALRNQGHCVAMTGDGVNDLLALKEADCSIAVASGSDAARQVSQVVLLNSDFSALPDVLRQGRRVVNNITRVAGVFFVKTIYSILLSIVCILLHILFPFLPSQMPWRYLRIEGYPAFFMSFEPNGKKIKESFLPAVMKRALPNAASILICFILLLLLSLPLRIPAEQASVLLYLLVGTVGIQAVFKASWPFNKLRLFLCVTMTAGFFAAVFLFHGILHAALPTAPTLLLFISLALLSFLIERAGTAVIKHIAKRHKEQHINKAMNAKGGNGSHM